MSVPASGSVTPNACRRNLPEDILGKYLSFCSLDPCLSNAPIIYICAWQAAPLPPDLCISSRIIHAAWIGRPDPPYSSGIKQAK